MQGFSCNLIKYDSPPTLSSIQISRRKFRESDYNCCHPTVPGEEKGTKHVKGPNTAAGSAIPADAEMGGICMGRRPGFSVKKREGCFWLLGVVSDRRIQILRHKQISERGVSLDLVLVTEQRRRTAQTVEEDGLFHSGQVWTVVPRYSGTAAGRLLPARHLRKRKAVGRSCCRYRGRKTMAKDSLTATVLIEGGPRARSDLLKRNAKHGQTFLVLHSPSSLEKKTCWREG